jgi:hypothetical protein
MPNRVHRRADLVAHVGQEVALGLAGGVGHLLGLAQLRGALLDHVLEVLAVALQLVVGLLLLGDVARDAQQEARLAVRVQDGDLHRVHEARAAPREHLFLGDVDHLARFEHRAVLHCEEVGLVPGEQVVHVAADQLVAPVAQQRLAGAVEADEGQRGRVLDEDHVGDVLDDAVQEALAGAQRLLGVLALDHLARAALERRAEFGGALVDARLEVGVQPLQRVLGLPALAPVLEELLDGACHVGDLVAPVHGHVARRIVAESVAQRAADRAQAGDQAPSQQLAHDQPGQQQAGDHLRDDPALRASRLVDQLLHRAAIVAREPVRLLVRRDGQCIGLRAQVGVEVGERLARARRGRRPAGGRQRGLAHLRRDVDGVAKALAAAVQGQHVDVVATVRRGDDVDQVVERGQMVDDLAMRVAHAVHAVAGRQLQRHALDGHRVLQQVLRLLQSRQPLLGQLPDRLRRAGQRPDRRRAHHAHERHQAGHDQRELRRQRLRERQLHGRFQMRR